MAAAGFSLRSFLLVAHAATRAAAMPLDFIRPAP
jgi:hypothetical protein